MWVDWRDAWEVKLTELGGELERGARVTPGIGCV